MGKIGNLIKAYKYLLSNPGKATIQLYRTAEEEEKKKHVIRNYNLPKGLPTIDYLDLFPNLDEEINTYSFSKGISALTDMALIKGLARRFDSCDFLEIGTQKGETIVNVAEVAKNCVSLSLSDDEIRGLGLSEDYVKMQRFFSEGKPNIKHHGHNSMTFDFSSLNQKFDLIFIDGDHTYNGVLSDTKNAFKLLKNDNSIIVWHDYAPGFQETRWDVLAAILDGAPKEAHKHIYHASNSICAVYIKGDFATRFCKFPELPDKVFSLNVRAKKL